MYSKLQQFRHFARHSKINKSWKANLIVGVSFYLFAAICMTNWHLSEIGIRNGGVEVKLGDRFDQIDRKLENQINEIKIEIVKVESKLG